MGKSCERLFGRDGSEVHWHRRVERDLAGNIVRREQVALGQRPSGCPEESEW